MLFSPFSSINALFPSNLRHYYILHMGGTFSFSALPLLLPVSCSRETLHDIIYKTEKQEAEATFKVYKKVSDDAAVIYMNKGKKKVKNFTINQKQRINAEAYYSNAITPIPFKKKLTQKYDLLKTRKRSLSKESLLKLKRKSSYHVKTERIRSYSNVKEFQIFPIKQIGNLEDEKSEKFRKSQSLLRRCQNILAEYQIKCEELERDNKRLSSINERLSSEKSYYRKKYL